MRQATMTAPGKIEFADVPELKAGKGEILIRVRRIGVCGSDIHVNHGEHPFTSYPVIQGHEFSGVVEQVGEGVEGVKDGMKATARPQVVCWQCGPCKRGDYNICDVLKVEGFQTDGWARDLFVTTKDKFIPLPDSMSFEQGALVEPTSCGVHAVSRGPDLKGRNVVVLGAAAIGNLVAQVVRSKGAKKILIGNYSGGYKLDIAKKCGFENTFFMKDESLEDAVKRVFGDEKYDVGFEATGAEQALNSLITTINKGGNIVVMGVFPGKPAIEMSIMGDREISLIGTLMYKHEDYEEAVRLIASGEVITEPLVTKHFPFEQYMEAYKYIDEHRNEVMKVVMDMD